MNDQRLTHDEARELLPLYVAGRLEPTAARALKKLLRDDESLQADLRMWRVIAQVSRNRSSVQSENHIEPELLVAFAEGPSALSTETQSHISEHLTACTNCRADLQMIKESLVPESQPIRAVLTDQIWRYAAAAVILLALLGTFLTIRQGRGPDEGGKSVTLNLPYLESYRSPTDTKLTTPILGITERTDSVILRVDVPLPPARIHLLAWSLSGPDQQRMDLEAPVRSEVDSTGYALVWLEIPATKFSRDGAYSLKARSSSDGEFVYDFVVTRR